MGEKHRLSGFALVEMVTAFAVFSLGLLGIIQSYHFAMGRVRTLRESAMVDRVIQDEIERLRAMPFGQLADCEKAPLTAPNPALADIAPAQASLSIRPYGDPALSLKHAQVAVVWRGDNGRRMSRVVDTLIGAGRERN